VAVDALLGTGAKGSLRQPILRGVEAFNRLKCRKVAVDLPTGVNSDTGEIMGEAVKADLTVTFHAKKIGLAKVEDLCGEIVVADIGIPPEAELYAGPGDVELVTRPRPPESHKGQFGRLLIIGGSETYVGAPALVGLAALRAGVDLAFVAAPEKTALAIATHSPDLITIRLPGDYLKSEAVKLLEDQIDRASAVAIGPGLGLRSETVSAVKELVQVLSRSKKPSLLDADALKAIGPVHDPLGFPAVVTPHAGEFAALSGSMPSKDLHSRMEEVRSLAMKIGGTVLLKGHVDVISDGSRIKLNWTGNPGMTVGGTGDVLSGIVACFLAQGSDGFEASVAGAFINGAAGDLALSKYGFHLIPTDLIDLIPQVMNDPMSHRELRRQPLNGPIFSE
jgi:NAD(P)H-hydrate epimerase